MQENAAGNRSFVFTHVAIVVLLSVELKMVFE